MELNKSREDVTLNAYSLNLNLHAHITCATFFLNQHLGTKPICLLVVVYHAFKNFSAVIIPHSL